MIQTSNSNAVDNENDDDVDDDNDQWWICQTCSPLNTKSLFLKTDNRARVKYNIKSII